MDSGYQKMLQQVNARIAAIDQALVAKTGAMNVMGAFIYSIWRQLDVLEQVIDSLPKKGDGDGIQQESEPHPTD